MIKPASFYCSLYIDFKYEINTVDFSKKVDIQTKRGIKRIDTVWGCDNRTYKEYFSLSDALSDFFSIFKKQIAKLDEEIKSLDCEPPLIIIEIIIYDNEFPELCLDNENMEIIHKLNANVHFNISNENLSQ